MFNLEDEFVHAKVEKGTESFRLPVVENCDHGVSEGEVLESCGVGAIKKVRMASWLVCR